MVVTVRFLDNTAETVKDVVSLDNTATKYLITTERGIVIFYKKTVQIIFVESIQAISHNSVTISIQKY